MQLCNLFFFFKQKTAYEMRISDWSSDVCSSDLARLGLSKLEHLVVQDIFMTETAYLADVILPASTHAEKLGTFTNTDRLVQLGRPADRKSVVSGKSVSVRVDLGGRRIIKKKKTYNIEYTQYRNTTKH